MFEFTNYRQTSVAVTESTSNGNYIRIAVQKRCGEEDLH